MDTREKQNPSHSTRATEPPVSRRHFGKYLGIGAAALGALVLWIRGRDQTYPVTVVAQEGEIPVGGSKVFAYPQNDRPCFLLRPAAQTYIAFSRLCTHHGCPIFFHPEENMFACPCHGGVFSATNGAVLDGPPPKPLPQVILERRGTAIVATGILQAG